MGKITVVGSGSGALEDLTLRAAQHLGSAGHVYVRTALSSAGRLLRDMNIKAQSFDALFEKAESFDDLNEQMARTLYSESEKYGRISYVCEGSALVGESVLGVLINIYPQCDIECIEGIAGMGGPEDIKAKIATLSRGAYCVVCAADLNEKLINKRMPLLVSSIDAEYEAAHAKLALQSIYEDDMACLFCGTRGSRRIALYELDRQDDYFENAYLLVDAAPKARTDLEDFLDVMTRLRGPGGCPWDIEQTHESLIQSLIEECYEVVDAIEKNDIEALCEELGDVLMQVIFHALIASERGDFTIYDVIEGIRSKMVFRHPHVFADAHAETASEVTSMWEDLKKQEKDMKSSEEVFAAIPRAFPSLLYAEKVYSKMRTLKPQLAAQLKQGSLASSAEAVCAAQTEQERRRGLAELLMQSAVFAKENGIDAESLLKQKALAQAQRAQGAHDL